MTSNRRRVLFVLASLGGGGAERVIVTLLRRLDRSRFEPHLALVAKYGPYLKDVPGDVAIHDLKARRMRYAIPAIIRLAWKLRPPVVLSSMREVNFMMILVRPLLPRDLKLLVRESTLVSAHLGQESRHAEVWDWFYRRLYTRADKTICLSDSMLADLAEHFGVPREKMTRIYNPVDIAKVRELAAAGANPYSGAGPHLLAAGRLSNEKGFDLLLDAVALVRDALPSAQLTILGEGPLKPDLKAQKERLGLAEAVHLAGFHTNPYPYFQNADVFVLSSRYEGLPNVVLEALALGKPVVATDCPGVREILDGCRIGWLVPQNDARLLADAIISACDSNRGVSSGAGEVEKILQKFGAEQIVREYEALFTL